MGFFVGVFPTFLETWLMPKSILYLIFSSEYRYIAYRYIRNTQWNYDLFTCWRNANECYSNENSFTGL